MTPGRRRTYAPRVAPARRREQLLDAALDLIVTRGHDAATVDAVAEHAGVTKPVVYGVFTGRADLLAALLRREGAAALGQLAEVLPGDDETPAPTRLEDALPALLERFLDAVLAAPQRWHCVVMPMPGMPPEFHAARDATRRGVLGQITELVGTAVASGGLPADTDAELTAQAVVAVAETAARLVLTDPEAHPPERFASALRALAHPAAG